MNQDSLSREELELSMGLVPGLMSDEYIVGRLQARNQLANRTDARSAKQISSRSRPGHHWVKNPKAKGGGFWRKNRKGSRKNPTKSSQQSNNGFVTEIATTAAIAGAAALAKKLNTPTAPPPTQKLPTKTIIASTAAGAGIGAAAVAVIAQKQREEAVAQAYATGNENLKQNIEEFSQKEQKLQEKASQKEADLSNQIQELQTELKTNQNNQGIATEQLSVAQDRISTLERAENAAKERIKEKNTEIEQQKTSITAKEQEIAQLNSQIKQNTESNSQEIEQLQQQLITSNQELAAQREEVSQLETSLTKTQEMVKDVQSQRATLTTTVNNLSEQLEKSQQQVTESNQQNQNLQERVSQLETERENVIVAETEKVRSQLHQEQNNAIAEIDRQAAENLTAKLTKQQEKFTAQLTEKQAELDDEIARGNDPKPLKGQRASRGDLIATEEGGISLGASSRWGSQFFSLEFSTQHQKIASKADQLMTKAYQHRLLGLQRDFSESINSGLASDKSPSKRLLAKAKLANIADRKLIKQLTGREKELLPNVVEIEKTVATHNVREEVLGMIEESVRDRVKKQYADLLSELHKQEVNPKTLAAFDKRSKAIIKEANGQLDDTVKQLISPKFTTRMEKLVDDYLKEMPTENVIRRKNRNVSVQLSEKIIEEILGKKQDSVAYEIGRKQALLKLNK